jgi:DNA-binding MarR family transcriptional regulator
MVVERLLAALSDAGYGDIGEAHLKVLRYPPPDGVRPSALAQRAKMTKQAMNYLLVQLEELGYVRRHDGDANGRLVSLTERGWEVAALQRRTVRVTEREWAERVGEARFATFMQVLEEIALAKDAPQAGKARAPG